VEELFHSVIKPCAEDRSKMFMQLTTGRSFIGILCTLGMP
jgi:hypothetical protein